MRTCLGALLLLPFTGCYWMIWDPERGDDLDTAVYEASCGDGEIRRIATGQSFGSLADALAAADSVDGFCLGPGDYTVDESLSWDCGECDDQGASFTIIGAGSDRTTIGDASKAFGTDVLLSVGGPALVGRVQLEGATLLNLPLAILADEVEVADLALQTYGSSLPLFSAYAASIVARDLTIQSSMTHGGPFLRIHADGEIHGLTLQDNTMTPGELLEVEGDLAFEGLALVRNTSFSDEIGAVGFESHGELAVQGGQFVDNRLSGPLLRAFQGLTLEDVDITGNDSPMRGQVVVMDVAMVTGGEVAENRSPSAAFELGEEASLVIEGTDFGLGQSANTPCDVSVSFEGDHEARCIGVGLGPDASSTCDFQGCL